MAALKGSLCPAEDGPGVCHPCSHGVGYAVTGEPARPDCSHRREVVPAAVNPGPGHSPVLDAGSSLGGPYPWRGNHGLYLSGGLPAWESGDIACVYVR